MVKAAVELGREKYCTQSSFDTKVKAFKIRNCALTVLVFILSAPFVVRL